MLKNIFVVILMGCLNGAAPFSSEAALLLLHEADRPTVRGYFPQTGDYEITPEKLREAIIRLSTAKIGVEKTLGILRSPASARFNDNKHLADLGLSSWEDRLSYLEEEQDKALTALNADLAILNRAYGILFPQSKAF